MPYWSLINDKVNLERRQGKVITTSWPDQNYRYLVERLFDKMISWNGAIKLNDKYKRQEIFIKIAVYSKIENDPIFYSYEFW